MQVVEKDVDYIVVEPVVEEDFDIDNFVVVVDIVVADTAAA